MNTIRVVKSPSLLAFLATCFMLASLSGCGPSDSKAAISGKVTYKGSPVVGSTLNLTSATGAPYPVPINADGTFNVSGVPLGQMHVSIEPSAAPTGYNTQGMTPPKDVPAVPPPSLPGATNQQPTAIPAKYRSPQTSGLSWDIKPGSNKKDFDLTD